MNLLNNKIKKMQKLEKDKGLQFKKQKKHIKVIKMII